LLVTGVVAVLFWPRSKRVERLSTLREFIGPNQ